MHESIRIFQAEFASSGDLCVLPADIQLYLLSKVEAKRDYYMTHQKLSLLIEKCWDTKDIDSQFALLKEINALLPFHDRVEIPSLVTDDYCRRALEIIEDKIGSTLGKYSRKFSWP